MNLVRGSLRLLVLALISLCSPAVALSFQGPVVTKVDPPSWWANHSINQVRLLVRGSNLGGARVSSSNPALRTSNVRVNERGSYLFVDVDINRSAAAGKYSLVIETTVCRAEVPFKLESPLDPSSNF